MKKPPSLFNRLQWKLTISYTAITVVVLVLALLALLVSALSLLDNSSVTGTAFISLLRGATWTLSAPLSQEPVDTEAVLKWIEKTEGGQKLPLDDGTVTNLNSTGLNANLLIVLDRSGRVVAATRPSAPAGENIHSFLAPGEAQVAQNVLDGVVDPKQLWLRSDPNTILAASPVQSEDGHVVGALLLRITLPNTPALLGAGVKALLPLLAFFTAAAAIIGLVFGMFTARGLVRRLQEQMRAADAWGRGEFSRQIPDRSPDEIGQLGRAMNQMAAQLRDLVQTRQDLAAAEERNRLARDLHDSVKQQVFAVSMNLGAAEALWEREPEKARAALESASALARQAQSELAVLIQTLRPPQLAEKSLADALNEYVQTWQRLTGISAILRVDCQGSVPAACEEALYRVVQEALANVARHSAASAASLELACSPESVRLVIQDNGRGFDPAQVSRGLGLHSMRERIQAVGGILEISSGAQGTLLRAAIPLNPTAPGPDKGSTP